MQSSKLSKDKQEMSDALIISMCAPLINLIKLYLQYPSKNKFQAEKPDLVCSIEMLGQHLLPDFCIKNCQDLRVLNQMHNLMFLLCVKARKLFQSSVITAVLNNNRELEAFKRCLYEILAMLQQKDQNQVKKAIQAFFDNWKNDQINKNDACLQKIFNLLESNQKEIQEKEVINITNSFESDFEFIHADFINFRSWNYKQDHIEQCRLQFLSKEYSFQTELKNMFSPVNGQDEFNHFCEMFNNITKSMGNQMDAKIFWLTFFKTQKSCPAINFIQVIQMLCILNDVYELELIQSVFPGQTNWNQLIDQFNYVINFSLSSDAINIINKFIELSLRDENRFGFSLMRNQISFSQKYQKLSTSFISNSVYKRSKGLEQFDKREGLQQLVKIQFYHTKDKQDRENVKQALRYMAYDQAILPLPQHQLQVKITNGKHLSSFNFTGERAVFGIGNGDQFDLNFPFESRFIDSQMLIIQKDSKYFLKDCGQLINMVSKLDDRKQEQLFEGSIIDFGRSIKYHCTKCVAPQWSEFGITDPILEAIHFNFNDKIEKQPKIVFRVDKNMKTQSFCIGRLAPSNQKDLLLNCSNINTQQCTIQYDQVQGWTINEIGQKPSAKGTFVYLKTYNQFINKEPSNSKQLNQNSEFLIGFSQSTDYHLKLSYKFQNTEINEYNNSLKNRRLTLSKATQANNQSAKKLSTSDDLIKFNQLTHQKSSPELRISSISQINTSRQPSEFGLKEPEMNANRFETEEDIKKDIEIKTVNDLYDNKSEQNAEVLPFDEAINQINKTSSPEDLRKQIEQNYVADQDSFQVNQSTTNILNQTETDRISIGKKSNISRASCRLSIANIVKNTQLKFSTQTSLASPIDSKPSFAQQFKAIQTPQDTLLGDSSPKTSSPLLLNLQQLSPDQKKSKQISLEIVDHQVQESDQMNAINHGLSQYTSVGRESSQINSSMQQNQNNTIQVTILQKQVETLKSRENSYIQEIRQQRLELDEIRPKLAEKILENEDLLNQNTNLNKLNKKLQLKLQQIENYIESKGWQQIQDEQEEKDNSKLFDQSKEDSKNLLLNSIAFEVPEEDEEDEQSDSILNHTNSIMPATNPKIQTPSNKNQKPMINFNISELTFAVGDQQSEQLNSYRGSEQAEFKSELEKFNTPKDDLSENQGLTGEDIQITKISQNSEESCNETEQSIMDKVKMLENEYKSQKEDKIDINFILYDPKKQVEVYQLLQNTDDEFNKDQLKDQLYDLRRLIPKLKDIFQKLEVLKDQQIVIPLGYSGSGKSTLLTSLVFGPENLQKKQISRTINRLNSVGTNATSQTKSITDKVIDVLEESDINVFEIGHEKSRSKTFLPSIAKVTVIETQQSICFTDIAGFSDSGGEMIELINSLVVKYILYLAKSIKFLLPITYQQIVQNRGMDVREQIQLLETMCNSSNYIEIDKFVQPLVTRCSITDEEINIEELRSNLHEILIKNAEQKQKELAQNDINQQEEMPTDQENVNDDMMDIIDRFQSKLEIFDPLDRPIPSDDDQSIKRVQLLDRIFKMEHIESSSLNSYLSNRMYQILDKLFVNALKRCNDTLQHHLNKAKSKQNAYQDDFQADQTIVLYHDQLQFFKKHNLLTDVDQRITRLQLFMKQGKDMITNAKQFNSLSPFGQQVFEFQEQIFVCKSQKQYDTLVQLMFELRNKIDEEKKDKQNNESMDDTSERLMQCSKAERFLEDTVSQIANNIEDLIKFAYELRKHDLEDQYTFNFLNGQVKPSILVDLIMQNQWNQYRSVMEIKKNTVKFSISSAKQKSFLQFANENKKLKSNQMEKIIVDKEIRKDHSVKLQFLLTMNGFVIQAGNERTLSNIDPHEISQGTIQRLIWKKDSNNQCTWLPNPIIDRNQTNAADFHIQLNYGNVKPRLILPMSMLTKQSKQVYVSTKNNKQYNDNDKTAWKISIQSA